MAAKLRIQGDGVDITAQFNPTQVQLAKSALLKGVKNKTDNSEKQQYIRGRNEQLTFELLFDATLEDIDVKQVTDQLVALTLIQPKSEHPPIVTVIWGTTLAFKALTHEVQRTFTLFDEGGRPLRATVRVTFIEYKTSAEMTAEVGGQRSPHTQRWVVEHGDTLSSIAAAAYDDPALWRSIARFNARAVPDPLHLIPGTVLLVPPRPLEEVEP